MNRIRTLTGGFFCILFLISPALADESQEFLREALRGDNSEIMLGQLAAEQGRSPAVRAFGRILVDDHKKARDEVLGVEPRFSFPESQRISREAREKHFNLLAARGREFDRQFIDYMADVHQRKLDKFGDEAEKHHGQSSLLARRLLPTLQKHLIMAQSLQRREERPYEGWETQRRMGGPGKGWYYR